MGTPTLSNPKFRYDLEHVQCYGTGRLGVRLDEDEQHGLPRFPYLQRFPVEASRPGWRTMMWPL
uniref:Oxidored_molyb domain-containing protein n=1 Tax=Heterorhabditis bacteriophora TaxID=37862 RepID=A0A1I7WVR5_HETBA